ncbi:hypothetical protein B0H11DRAFT_2038361 [Mycena galericulata]|nr:hypothetical protein B0H11DRAFT_2038361 [Mycena galericulata]
MQNARSGSEAGISAQRLVYLALALGDNCSIFGVSFVSFVQNLLNIDFNDTRTQPSPPPTRIPEPRPTTAPTRRGATKGFSCSRPGCLGTRMPIPALNPFGIPPSKASSPPLAGAHRARRSIRSHPPPLAHLCFRGPRLGTSRARIMAIPTTIPITLATAAAMPTPMAPPGGLDSRTPRANMRAPARSRSNSRRRRTNHR